jgi:hypothetical protein
VTVKLTGILPIIIIKREDMQASSCGAYYAEEVEAWI